MLNILVCVKQIPDIDLVKMDPETGNLVRAGVPTLTNPLDLNALLQLLMPVTIHIRIILREDPLFDRRLRVVGH